MRIGISSPVVITHPATCADWERGAGIDELALIAETADRLGFHHMTCSEHIAVPVDVASERGGTYWDPLATLGFLAARTSRLRLVTQVLVLGYHHPLEIAKRYGTLDLVSGGRLTLGLGVGSLREEFDLLGIPFDDRGARADDAIAALRSALSRSRPEYHGPFYEFGDVIVEPHAVQDRVPLWIGGRTRRSLRRAVDHGDGWVPFGLALDELRAMIATVELPADFEMVLSTGPPMDPISEPDRANRTLERLRSAGATIAGITLTSTDHRHYCDQLAALHALGVELGCSFTEQPTSPPTGEPFMTDTADLVARVEHLEAKLAITELMTAYGPAVDSGSADAVARLWTEDGVYDVDTGILRGHAEIVAMVRSQAHQRWITGGCAHMLEPGHIRIDGDTAVATGKSQVIIRDGDNFRIARITANRWEFRRIHGEWKVTRRTSRLLDGRPDARDLLAAGVNGHTPGQTLMAEGGSATLR